RVDAHVEAPKKTFHHGDTEYVEKNKGRRNRKKEGKSSGAPVSAVDLTPAGRSVSLGVRMRRRTPARRVQSRRPGSRGTTVAIISSLFSDCPRVSKARGRLVAQTAWQVRLVTLGCLYREVVVDLKRDEVTVRRRYLWAFSRRRRVRFGAIAAV